MIMLPLSYFYFFDIINAASGFGTIIEVDLISVFLLCLSGIFLEVNYDIKPVF